MDAGNPVGWPDVLLDDGRAFVTWLERAGDGTGDLRLREFTPAGAAATALTVASASSGRTTGIPSMARAGDHLIVAWRQGQVRTARVPLPARGNSRR